MSLIWKSFARRLVQKKGKRKCQETDAPPAKRRKNMSVEACIARKVLHILEPSLDEEQLKKQQFNEINARKSPERVLNGYPAAEHFYQSYLIMEFDEFPKPVKMIFACKDFAIVSEIRGAINIYQMGLHKISLGSQWNAKFIEWVDEDWEGGLYMAGRRIDSREDIIEVSFSSHIAVDKLLQLF